MDYQDELTAKRRDALWRAVERERRTRGIRLPVAYLEGPRVVVAVRGAAPGWQWWAVRLGVGLGWLALGLGMGWLAATVEGRLL